MATSVKEVKEPWVMMHEFQLMNETDRSTHARFSVTHPHNEGSRVHAAGEPFQSGTERQVLCTRRHLLYASRYKVA